MDGAFAKFRVHALQRIQQRGVRMEELSLVLSERDLEVPVGSGCTALTISRGRRRELISEGYPPSVVDRTVGLIVVESAEGEIVTVLRSFGQRGRRYRAQFRSRQTMAASSLSNAA